VLPQDGKAQDRICVLDAGNLAATDPAALARALNPLIDMRGETEFWHCAAAVAFTEMQEGAVRRNNTASLQAVLAAAHAVGCSEFNHVSTAYVSGSRQGLLEEKIGPRPERFNNVYEESKFECEELVAAFREQTGLPYRIHRPSIIIGHSGTLRTSSRVGFYYCLDIVRQFYRKVTLGDSAFFRNRTLKVLLDADATVNLIPVDVVVAEMAAIRAGGAATLGKVFHETNPNPNTLNELVSALGEVLGVPNVEAVATEAGMGLVDKIFNKKMKLLNPYLSRRSQFDRGNVIAAGADCHLCGGAIDLEGLKAYARAYIREFDA
jgi:nucleoside-diphosphate-sugar epimerase